MKQFISVDMPKSGSFTLVLTVICLSVLMSLEADAQSTTDETYSCSSSSLEEVVNLVKSIASHQQVIKEQQEENAKKMEKISSNQKQNAKELKVVKELIAANSSGFEEVVNLVNRIASVQQENAEKMEKFALKQQENANDVNDIKELLAGNSSVIKEIAKVVKGIASNQEDRLNDVSKSCESETAEPTKQALVSALISKFVVL